MIANPYARIANNFVHDMATGTWAACVLVLWVLAGRVAGTPAEAAAAIAAASRAVFALLLGALVLLTLTGTLRLAYWRTTTPAEELPAKRRMLIAKHAAFLLVYGGGTWWAYTLL